MDASEKDVDVEQDYWGEDATKISKKKHPRYIAPQSMNRYAYLVQKRVIAPNVSRVLTSSKSHMQKGQVIYTRRAINISVPESDEGHTRGRSIVAERKLFAIDNNDDHGERDMRFHDINEEQDVAETDDSEDIDMNEAYEEQDSYEDGGNKDVDDLENENDEPVEKELEVPQPENEEEYEVLQPENEAGLSDLLDCFIFSSIHILCDT
ncbi:hypothetical protein M8C21_028863 [Ambrosia artemisiifolia]|uniref:Uncharacterized protein n=1 Tax=Ambrosia artemisiifolia TaxID=4212 RepID=A0AAD5GG96_AMBAR|nr:hypothetical protein M8C21_028863 [Ambrosia artemisiifolia]